MPIINTLKYAKFEGIRISYIIYLVVVLDFERSDECIDFTIMCVSFFLF